MSLTGFADPLPIQSARPSLQDVHSTFERWLYLPDPAIVDVSLATLVSHRMGGDPVWVLLVGPPGGGKTEVINALRELPEVHALSALTAQTFASGFKGKARASLLHRLDEAEKSFLTLKDLTTVLTMHREARAEILAQLREIYDGSYRKEFGTGESVSWDGRLGFLGGVTPVIDSHHAVVAVLGERFIYLRLPELDRRRMSQQALAERGSEHEMRAELRVVVRGYVESLDLTDRPAMPETARGELVGMADFATLARSGVMRDGHSREITARPIPEAPTRFVKQIAGVYLALRAMGYENEAALGLVRRMALDCIPPARLAILRALREQSPAETSMVCDAVHLPDTTTRRELEDLTALGLVNRTAGLGGRGGGHRWALTVNCEALWAEFDAPEVVVSG